MANLQILVPEATTNYIQNPSMRYDTTGWNASGSGISRVLTHARHGIASLEVITNGTVISEGAYYRVNGLSTLSDELTVSAYVLGTGHVRIRLVDNPFGGEWKSEAVTLRTDRWTRISVSGRSTGSDDLRLYVETFGLTARSATFYVDAAQMETLPYSTTYCDGTRPGCRWNGLDSGSTSSRSAYTREGGRWVMISGAYREVEDVYMTVVSGLGVAPITMNSQSYASAPGGFMDNSKINERKISLQFHVKHKSIPRTCKQALSLSKLHELRQMLIDIVKPDKTGGVQPFWIEYQDGDVPLYMQVYYVNGLEGDWDIRNQWMMNFPLNLVATSPMFVEDNQEVASLDFSDAAIFQGVAGRINGEWKTLNGGIINTTAGSQEDGTIEQFALGPKGEVYAVGNFTRVNVIGASYDTAYGLAYWDGTRWVPMITSFISTQPYPYMYSAAVAPNGDIYVSGTFSSINGVAANNIAKWNGTTWSALGTGLGPGAGVAIKLALAPNGDLYACGNFHTAGGIACWHIARWDGSSWHSMGATAGLNGHVDSICISQDGTSVYAGGLFTDNYGIVGTALSYVAKYTPSTNLFSALGSGLDARVKVVILSDSGYLYAGGSFVNSGVTPVYGLAKWNGTLWVKLWNYDDPLHAPNVNEMDIDKLGNMVVIAGNTGDGPTHYYNGSTWTFPDIVFAVNSVNAGFYDGNDDLFLGGYLLGYNVAGPTGSAIIPSHFSGITYVTNNGTAEIRPTIYIKGQGSLKWLENQSSQKRIYFDLDVLANEEIFIDFGAGTINSTVRGSLLYTILPGSDFHGFTLLPGVNKIATFMANDVNAVMTIYHTPTHWSADSTMRGDTF
jgi:hypothetical protein